MTHPLVLWAAALVAATVGHRSSRPQHKRAREWPPIVHVVDRWPVPHVVVCWARKPVEALGAAAGASDAQIGDLASRRIAVLGGGCAITIATTVFSPLLGVMALAATAVGIVWPVVSLRRNARARRARIVGDLPDLIDIVVLCSSAGLAIEPALRHAAERLGGPCGDEIARTLVAVELGTPRRDAFSDLATRIGAPEVSAFVGTLLQSDELGTPVAESLRRQAEFARSAAHQQVRERAAQAAPHVQLVVAMIMVPGALVAILGVMILNLLDRLATVGVLA